MRGYEGYLNRWLQTTLPAVSFLTTSFASSSATLVARWHSADATSFNTPTCGSCTMPFLDLGWRWHSISHVFIGPHTHQSHQSRVPVLSQSFRHQVRQHIICRAIFNVDSAFLDMVSDKMELDIDMFHLCMMCRVLSKRDTALIITEENRGFIV